MPLIEQFKSQGYTDVKLVLQISIAPVTFVQKGDVCDVGNFVAQVLRPDIMGNARM